MRLWANDSTSPSSGFVSVRQGQNAIRLVFCTKRNQGSQEKGWILGLGQEIHLEPGVPGGARRTEGSAERDKVGNHPAHGDGDRSSVVGVGVL